jgi:hypothetical protein
MDARSKTVVFGKSTEIAEIRDRNRLCRLCDLWGEMSPLAYFLIVGCTQPAVRIFGDGRKLR